MTTTPANLDAQPTCDVIDQYNAILREVGTARVEARAALRAVVPDIDNPEYIALSNEFAQYDTAYRKIDAAVKALEAVTDTGIFG